MPTVACPDLASPRFKADPYPFYTFLRRNEPVFRAKLAAWLPPVWLVTRYDDVLSILKDHERFSNTYVMRVRFMPQWMRPLTRNMLMLDPPDHTRLRALVQRAFTPRIVENLRTRIELLCDRLLDRMALARQTDLIASYALPVPLTVIGELFDIPEKDRHHFVAWSTALSKSTSGGPIDALSSMPYVWRVLRYFRRLIEQRRRALSNDLLSELIRAEEEGDRLSEDELLGMTFLLLIAGYETTAGLISTGSLELLCNPDQRRVFREGAGTTAVEELLRFTSPADMAPPRVAKQDVTVSSVKIARGDLVLPVLGSANRDESRFREPDTLNLTRDPNKHLALGMGAHFCVGAPLARLEGDIALTKLFARFPEMKLAVKREELPWKRALAFRALKELPVRV